MPEERTTESEAGLGETRSVGERAASSIRMAPEGLRLTLCLAAPALLALAVGLRWTAAMLGLAAAAVAAFFRDPARVSGAGPGAILAGADGKVCDVREGPLPGGPRHEIYRQISVFMSPLNAHVNRAPVGGKVVYVQHTPGELRAAFRDDASDHNERNVITLRGEGDRRYVIVQVAGYLARRIVCRVRAGETVARGQRLGLIMFGSRVDHFIPREFRVTVGIGDRVRAGTSVIGELASDEN